jgi:hypothetical protein
MAQRTDILLTIEQLEHALDYINPDLPYVEWARVGRAIKAVFGEEAFSSFDSWSASGSSYKQSEVRSQWKNWGNSYAGGKRPGLGTIIHFAKLGGWKPTGANLSPEEKVLREKERAEAAARRAKQEAAAAAEREKLIAGSLQDFMRLPAESGASGPTLYMLAKGMADLGRYIGIRYGRQPGALGRWFAWPLYDDDPRANAEAAFCGYERVFDERNTDGKNKFISRHGKNNRGFGVLGPALNATKRAFVVGGIADAYSAHVASGETVVATVGEGNIPGIIRHLQQRYPDVEFIAAPDHDKAGLHAAKALCGFWTVPEQQGQDWSDVYLISGAAEVKRQLTAIKGFKHNLVDQRYLDITVHPGLNLVKSAKETGKSYSTARYVEQNPGLKVLVISYRRNLLQSLAQDFKAEYYEELIAAEGRDRNIMLRMAQRLVITPDSLWRLHGSRWDMVFVDEAEQTLQHFLADTMAKREFNAEMFKFLLISSEIQILADADLSDLTLQFCDYLGLHHGVFHHNSYRPRVGSKMYVYESPNHLNTIYKDRLHAGERLFYCSNSKRRVKNLSEQLEIEQRRNTFKGKFFAVCSENASEDETAAIVKSVNDRIHDWQTVLASPSWGTGISIRRDDHYDHGMQATFGLFTSRSGTAEQAHQQLARARGITEYHVYIDPTERNEYTDPNIIRRLQLDEPTQETAEYLRLGDEGELEFRSEIYEWIYCHVTAHLNLSKNKFKARFLAQAEAEGYEIVHVAKNELAVRFGKEDAEAAGHRLDRFDLMAARDADLLDDDQFHAAKNGSNRYSHQAVKKTEVYRDLNLAAANDDQVATLEPLVRETFAPFRVAGELDDEAPVPVPADPREALVSALAFREITRHEVGRIKKLAVAALPADVARQMDIKDRKFSASRAALRHTAKRRQHLLRILKSFGLDEQLNYNGNTWCASRVANSLRTWLRNNRDSLYKYSHITLTDKAFEEPLQWAHGFLERNGLKVELKGQQTVKGKNGSKRERIYGLDEGHLEMMRELVMLRVAGIEQGLKAADTTRQPAHPGPMIVINNSGQGVQQPMAAEPSTGAACSGSEEPAGERKNAGISAEKDLLKDLQISPAKLDKLATAARHAERQQRLGEGQAQAIALETLNRVDIERLNGTDTAALAAHIARVRSMPAQAMATVLSVSQQAGLGAISAMEYLSDSDVVDVMTGDLDRERLGLYFNGIISTSRVG